MDHAEVVMRLRELRRSSDRALQRLRRFIHAIDFPIRIAKIRQRRRILRLQRNRLLDGHLRHARSIMALMTVALAEFSPFLNIEALPSAPVEALYIHIPFCFHKCHYCDFYSITRQTPERMSRFVDLILRETDMWRD